MPLPLAWCAEGFLHLLLTSPSPAVPSGLACCPPLPLPEWAAAQTSSPRSVPSLGGSSLPLLQGQAFDGTEPGGSRLCPAGSRGSAELPSGCQDSLLRGRVALPDIAGLEAWVQQVPICRARPVPRVCSAASWPELLSLELFACLFIAQVLLKIIGLGQTHLWH